MRKLTLSLIFVCLCLPGFATSFTSKDEGFTIPLPTRWQNMETIDTEVLRLQNGDNRITAIPLDKCNELSCLEKIIEKRVKQVKSKKFQLLKNTYSGEEIKKTEFSTLDPLLYFSYIANKKNYTEGYFLADSKGYKIEVTGLPYLEAENYLLFISPKPKEIQDLPLITEEETLTEENIAVPNLQDTKKQSLNETLANTSVTTTTKQEEKKFTVSRELSNLILLIFLYLFIVTGFFSYNIFFSQKQDKTPTNPKSFYPIRGSRLYGSPDLFLRFYDSQGQNFIVTSQRWGSFLVVGGFYSAIFFLVLHFALNIVLKQITINPLWANTALSLCYLFAAFGFIFMVSGKVLTILFPPAIFIYNDKGAVLFKITRKGSGMFNYAYLVMSSESETIFRLETPRLFPIRKWMLFDKTGELAIIKEKSALKALARKLLGHLGGSLRASYQINGRNESKGEIMALRKVSANFQIDIDKPQAFSPMAMLVAAAVISIVNRDKYYPWFS